MTLPYQTEQQIDYQIEYWDTPFSTLYNNVASNGMLMDVYEIPSTFSGVEFETMTLSNWATELPAASTVLANGRMPNAIGYWSGGAPGYHGVSTNRQVAYRIQGVVKTEADRAWWSATSPTTMKFACAGSGRMRITVNGTDVLPTGSRILSEEGFLTTGPTYSNAVSLATGDTVIIYYVQDKEAWGGFVVKPVIPTSTGAYTMDAYREAPVLGCGLVAYGTAPVVTTFKDVINVTTEIVPNQARRASFQVPLTATTTFDGVGWQWLRTSDDTGFLRLRRIQTADFDMRRQRLVRISMGFRSMLTGTSTLTPVFTGFTDDFEARDGIVTVNCLGFEQRLADQYVKNYPDKISYMSFGYTSMSGTQEPVFNITAYDNWPVEYFFRDLMIRGGIDEARLRAPVKVRQASGTPTTVTM